MTRRTARPAEPTAGGETDFESLPSNVRAIAQDPGPRWDEPWWRRRLRRAGMLPLANARPDDLAPTAVESEVVRHVEATFTDDARDPLGGTDAESIDPIRTCAWFIATTPASSAEQRQHAALVIVGLCLTRPTSGLGWSEAETDELRAVRDDERLSRPSRDLARRLLGAGMAYARSPDAQIEFLSADVREVALPASAPKTAPTATNSDDHGPGFEWLRIGSKTFEGFKRGQQREALRHLWRDREIGGRGISLSSLSELVGATTDRFRLDHVYRGHPAWAAGLFHNLGGDVYTLNDRWVTESPTSAPAHAPARTPARGSTRGHGHERTAARASRARP